MRLDGRCLQCLNCEHCHQPKDNFIPEWTVDVPPGFPVITITEEMSEDDVVETILAIPRYYDYDGKPCSQSEAMYLKFGARRDPRPNPNSRVGVSYVRYRRRWYAVLTDYLLMNEDLPFLISVPSRHFFMPTIYKTWVTDRKDFGYKEKYKHRDLAKTGHKRLVRALKSGKLHAEKRSDEREIGIILGKRRWPYRDGTNYKYRKSRRGHRTARH